MLTTICLIAGIYQVIMFQNKKVKHFGHPDLWKFGEIETRWETTDVNEDGGIASTLIGKLLRLTKREMAWDRSSLTNEIVKLIDPLL